MILIAFPSIQFYWLELLNCHSVHAKARLLSFLSIYLWCLSSHGWCSVLDPVRQKDYDGKAEKASADSRGAVQFNGCH